ncbi:hypothetical protein KY290_019513 [Solanum tuberosum]|uniref:Uncharacterized protein n=1 Tax=Solanum tuberosum TaxID=4113 RepID=A0ABQ7VHA3_SOLTU|nr:hypothetical protein KY284_018410 [Solanum tuberosum]KAH0691234.1 hypothetical protein KY289_018592 [Solanum tuberosum]KAH0704148.1 hypothetical protein KY285_018426 [Solanum tuberosum]KAH0763440.1 hypothetical protein KY290_019513 [Solanum tuberosum]
MFEKILAVLFVGFVAYAYSAMQPPPPKICGTPDGPSVTSPRIKHSDGRYLAYKEHGLPRDQEKHKIVFILGYGFNRHDAAVATGLSPVALIHLPQLHLHFNRSHQILKQDVANMPRNTGAQ